jgi:acetyl esterase/lipase
MLTITKALLAIAATAAILAAITACSPLKVLNALTPSSGYVKTADIAYGPDARNRLDVYKPTLKSSAKPAFAAAGAPVVVFFYGGSWNSGSRTDYDFVGQALAARGIVTVIADYRLYPQVRYPLFIEDGAQAVSWVAQHIADYGGDAHHLFVMGHSSGAYNAAMLALDPQYLAAVHMQPADLRGWIGLAGPYDFLPIENRDVRPVFFFPDSPPASQPINQVTRAAPNTLLIAANKDNLVNPVRNTGGLADKLRQAGVPVQEQYYDGVTHTTLIATFTRPLRGLAPALDRVVAFIESDGGR